MGNSMFCIWWWHDLPLEKKPRLVYIAYFKYDRNNPSFYQPYIPGSC